MFLHQTISGLLVPHGVLLPDHQYTALLLSVSVLQEKDLRSDFISSRGYRGRGESQFQMLKMI